MKCKYAAVWLVSGLLACETKKSESSAELRPSECGNSSSNLCDDVASDATLRGESDDTSSNDEEFQRLLDSSGNDQDWLDPSSSALLLTGIQSYLNFRRDQDGIILSDGDCHELVAIKDNLLIVKLTDQGWLEQDNGDLRKDCLLNVRLRYPGGMAFAIDKIAGKTVNSQSGDNLKVLYKANGNEDSLSFRSNFEEKLLLAGQSKCLVLLFWRRNHRT